MWHCHLTVPLVITSAGTCPPPGSMGLTPSYLQGAFPARLKKVFIVGAPMWFRVPYSIISLLLKEKLRERVSGDPFAGRAEPVFLLGQGGACLPRPRPLVAADPKSVGNGAFLSLFSWGQPVSVFSANYLEPLLKSPTVSSSAVRLPAAAESGGDDKCLKGKETSAEHVGEKGNLNTCVQVFGKAKNT